MIFFFAAFSFGNCIADDVRVSAQVDAKTSIPNSPIRGTLTIQHNQNQKIDPDSFSMDGQPLKAEFLRDVEFAPNSPLRISIYQFSIKPMPAGLQILPPIAVKIGGELYKSTATTYEVITPSRVNNTKKEPILNLEAYAKAPSQIFPGQRFSVGYRIYYNDNIDLQTQELPLLEAQGFKKVGAIKITDVNEGNLSVRGMEQEVEAVNAGKFTFGPSMIVGNVYRKDNFGRNQISKNNIRADADTVTITISDFPEKDKPASFNGSVGEDIDFSVDLLSYKEMQVGDKISLGLKFSGKGDLSTINIPKICCEPGFPGFFEPSDIPPIPTPGSGNVVYYVELRPLSPKIRAIPPIEFSYFNPQKGNYEIKRSEAIPITVNPAPTKELPLTPGMPEKQVDEASNTSNLPKQESAANTNEVEWPKTTPNAGAIEIETIYPLSVSDLTNRNFGTWEVLLVIPLGLLALYIQWDYIQKRNKRLAEVVVKTSFDYYKEAKESRGSFSEFYTLLTKGLILRLQEIKLIEPDVQVPEELPLEGVAGSVRALLLGIEKERFTGKQQLTKEEIISQADKLFKMMS
jgi:hypothetical protein